MSDKQVIRGWEERVISQEKGNRAVHFIIRDTTGYDLLAVVGTERSARHMIYTVAAEFISVFGSTDEVPAGKKWKTRRDVVDCLASVVSKRGPILADSKNNQTTETAQFLEHLAFTMARFSTRRSPSLVDEEIQGSSDTVEEKSDIVWSGDSWMCTKQLTHYPSFCRNGTSIPVYSFVWVLGEEGKDLLGYVEDMYEDQHGEKMVRVRWFNFVEELGIPIPELNPHCREVFITPHEQDISAECIDGLAAILTPSHLEKCFTLLPESISSGSLMCHREVKNKNVKSFSLSKLRGYATQPILHALEYLTSKKGSNRKDSNFETSAPEEPAMHGSKRSKGLSENSILGNDFGDKTSSPVNNHVAKCENTRQRLKMKISGKRSVDNNLVVSEAKGKLLSELDKNIEFLCQDSGLRGCWFRCKILHEKDKRLKVQYYDVVDVEGGEKLEEWILASRKAHPDKLGVRCAGRLTVRPWPLCNSSSNSTFEVGASVDAYWCDGWWEGVVIGCDPSSKDNLQIYLPGENKFLTIGKNSVRVSKDWIDNKWVDVKAKPDILSCINLIRNPELKLKPIMDLSKTGEGSGTDNSQVQILNFKKQLLIQESVDKSGTSSGNACGDGTPSKIEPRIRGKPKLTKEHGPICKK